MRLALAVYWPDLFDSIHEYAYSEAVPYGAEADKLLIHNAMHELMVRGDAFDQVLAEMDVLRVSPLDAFAPGSTGTSIEDVSPLMASLRSLREVIKTLMGPNEVAQMQAEYRAKYVS